MSNQLDDLAITIGRFGIGETTQSGRRLKSSSFSLHFCSFSSFRFGKLGGNDDKAEIDHEERADLKSRRKKLYNAMPECQFNLFSNS